MATPCHILVENHPAFIYASRNGGPNKILPLLTKFLDRFWQERDTAGENRYTPECLLAQLVVRFGFEFCEDDYSNLRVGMSYDGEVEYLYRVSLDRKLSVWVPEAAYQQDPSVGLEGCRQLEDRQVA